MQIAKDTVVTLNYRVTDPDGNLIDDGQRPLVYLHGGYDGIFSRIEEALHGMSVGEQLEVKLQPDDAFGDYDADLVRVEGVLETDPKALAGQIPFRFVAHKVELQHPYKVPVIVP